MSSKSENKSIFDKIPIFQKLKSIKHLDLIIVAIFAIVLVVLYMSTKSSTASSSNVKAYTTVEQYAEYLEAKLSNVVGNINGAGKVSVMITLDGGITYEYATESEETTTSSSVSNGTNTKSSSNETIVIVSSNGSSSPIIVKEIYPPVSGVVVVSSGAKSVAVRMDILKAVQALLNVNSNNVEILVGEQK